VAERYACFLRAVAEGAEWRDTAAPLPPRPAKPAARAPERPASPEPILEWAPPDPLFREYLDTHLSRLTKTLQMTPPGGPEDRVLEMGAYLQITPALRSELGYGEVRGCYYGPAGKVERRAAVSTKGERFECDLDLFDAEKDVFPYPDGYFATVLCCELIEHLFEDPMHMMSQINRILREGGHLVLTTPNLASLRAISGILQGYHPGLFPQYIKPAKTGETDPRHNREYTPREIRTLLEDSGFEAVRLETGPFRDQLTPELAWVRRLLERYMLDTDLRDDGIYAVGRKTGPVVARFPEWLYA
jgi:SAM-dependent methyltransferase